VPFSGHRWRSANPTGTSRLPKMNFPQFDGENPKLWLTRCEDYFDLYNLDPAVRVRFTSMNFSAVAGRWLQSVEKRLRTCTWEEFARMLLDRFGRDQHELLISTTRFSPYCNKSLRQHHYFGCNRGVLLHRNGALVAICVSIATQNLSCIIYLFGCNMLTLMHPILGFPLHFVGNNATPILCCISIPYVATESCYSHHTRDGCV
jgi:hypothetical protein